MAYATIMVCLRLERSNAGLLRMAGGLAERFHARVIGVATRQPTPFIYSDTYVPAEIIEQDREEIRKSVGMAEEEFRGALADRADKLEFRSMLMFGPLADYVADEARSADLVLVEADAEGAAFDPLLDVDIGDLAMRAGRPLLVAPSGADAFRLNHALVGWKDTRETRRAIVDALPLLEAASHVTVVEIAAQEEIAEAMARLQDVVGWLERHGVRAESIAAPSTGEDAGRLKAIAREQGADLIVAGAYGHARLREWAFGGVTRDLLRYAGACSLVSH